MNHPTFSSSLGRAIRRAPFLFFLAAIWCACFSAFSQGANDDNALTNPSVFDWRYYGRRYLEKDQPDWKEADARRHYLEKGLAQGFRSAPAFDVKQYLDAYPDLQSAFGTDYRAATRHFVTDGIVNFRSGRWIEKGDMAIGISPRVAGAINSLVYKGRNYINDWDHGRQLQVAWVYNQDTEAYNPTEGGSRTDHRGPTSASRLLKVRLRADDASLYTECNPAYWYAPSGRTQDYSRFERVLNTAPISNDKLIKRVTIGFRDLPNVVLFETRIELSKDLTGEPIRYLRIEAPTAYLKADFETPSLFNPDDGSLQPADLSRFYDQKIPMGRFTIISMSDQQIPILSTPDKKHAMALYTSDPRNLWTNPYVPTNKVRYACWVVRSKNIESGCGKLTSFFAHPAQAGQAFQYRSYIIVGTLEEVRQTLVKMVEIHKDWKYQ